MGKGNYRVAVFSAVIIFLFFYSSSFELAVSDNKDAVGLLFGSVDTKQLAVFDSVNMFTQATFLPSHIDRLRVTFSNLQAVNLVANDGGPSLALASKESPIKSMGAVLDDTVVKVIDDKSVPPVLEEAPRVQSAVKVTETGAVDRFATESVITETVEADEQIFLVRFGFDSAELDENSMTTIQRAIGAIQGRKEGVAVIAGYSGPLGNTAYNLALSRKRAQAVANFLLALGVSSDRLRVEGRGAYAPLGLKASEELPELSRIAQIIIEKSGEW